MTQFNYYEYERQWFSLHSANYVFPAEFLPGNYWWSNSGQIKGKGNIALPRCYKPMQVLLGHETIDKEKLN